MGGISRKARHIQLGDRIVVDDCIHTVHQIRTYGEWITFVLDPTGSATAPYQRDEEVQVVGPGGAR